MPVKIAVIGCGHWGKNFVRVVRETPRAELVAVVDEKPSAIHSVLDGRNNIFAWSPDQLFASSGLIDAVIVATTAETHYEIVKKAILRGWDVLAEKPFTRTEEQGEELIGLAESRDTLIMLGHTFLYNPAVRKMKELVVDGAIGDPYYLHARRTHLGLIRDDVNAIWDLAPHDIAIANYLFDAKPTTVSAVGGAFLRPDREDVGFVTMTYRSGVVANLFVSWADSDKTREVQVVGSGGRIVFNDLEPLERVKVIEKGIATNMDPHGYGEYQLSLRDGDIYSPKVSVDEPLRLEVAHFVECVEERTTPVSDAHNGLDIVRVLTAIDASMQQNGAPVEVSAGAPSMVGESK